MTLELEMRIAELERENKILRGYGEVKAMSKAFNSWLQAARALKNLSLTGKPDELSTFLNHFDRIGNVLRGDDQ